MGNVNNRWEMIHDRDSWPVTGAVGPVTDYSAYLKSIEGANGPAGPANVSTGTAIRYKYDEGRYIKEITEYVNDTYGEHYSRNKFQATEFIMDSGHGTGFCMGNVMKYAQRYGRKGSREDWRKDLMKVIHYAMMQLYVHDVIDKEKK